ncbi:asparaginase [Haladaptatus caseinilyticus]|uniref:asparaginase n=1 Tax=Haladaptatus caseinilyticus TaxID=2993314 RepID=UPI00224B512B|nr:asparaginase [Haladaptatus caseinilyticus]
MRPTITILGTGGTIASTDDADGAKPTMSSESLVEAVPQLADDAEIDVREVAQKPSFSMDFQTIESLRGTIREIIGNGADGIVVTHGTDTMEESAYYLDLTLDIDAPVVFTGAQRRPDEVSPDGPSNLLTAVRVLVDERVRKSGGVYVVFDEELHPARDVTKRHTHKLDAFDSPGKGPVATVTRDEIRYVRTPGSYSDDIDVDGDPSDIDVRVVNSGVGVGDAQIEEALDAGVDGIVLEGTGIGNVTAELGDAVEQTVSADVPVVVTSRCYAGTTVPVYGTDGGGRTLAEHGAIGGDDLPAHKARLKLLLALLRVNEPSEVQQYFSDDNV